jgi:hypothetical protein
VWARERSARVRRGLLAEALLVGEGDTGLLGEAGAAGDSTSRSVSSSIVQSIGSEIGTYYLPPQRPLTVRVSRVSRLVDV